MSGESSAKNIPAAAIRICVNNEIHAVPAGMNVVSLLAHLRIRADRVAIERNLQILPRDAWEKTYVEPEDHFEIVHFVGGG